MSFRWKRRHGESTRCGYRYDWTERVPSEAFAIYDGMSSDFSFLYVQWRKIRFRHWNRRRYNPGTSCCTTIPFFPSTPKNVFECSQRYDLETSIHFESGCIIPEFVSHCYICNKEVSYYVFCWYRPLISISMTHQINMQFRFFSVCRKSYRISVQGLDKPFQLQLKWNTSMNWRCGIR